jgi:hypothetical protein
MLGLPTTEIPPQATMGVLIPLTLLTLVVISILLGECFQDLYPRYWQRLLSIWLCNYLVYYLLNTLDALLFSPLPNMSTSIVANIFPALFMAAIIAVLWRPREDAAQGIGIIPKYFSARKPINWAWRLAVAWLVFPVIYYLMGSVVGPFVQPYYEDPSLNLGLTMPPSLGILLAMQVLRGALFLIAVLPIILGWRGSQLGLWLWVGVVIFVQIAAQVILQAYGLPVGLRVPHSLELLADSFLQAGVYALLLCYPMKLIESKLSIHEPVASP